MTDFANHHNLTYWRNWALATCIVSMVVAFGSFAYAYHANTQSNRALERSAEEATVVADQAKAQVQFQHDTFCGLVQPIVDQAKLTPPPTPFGQRIASGSAIASEKLSCSTPGAQPPTTTTQGTQ